MKYIFLLLFIIGLTFGDDDHEKHHDYHYKKDLSYLDLDYDQKHAIKKVLKHYRNQMHEYREYKEDILHEKQAIFKKDFFDENKLLSINEDLLKKSTQIEIELLKDIHSILSKEQREDFIKHLDEWDME